MSAIGVCRFCGLQIIDTGDARWRHEATGAEQCQVSATPDGLVLIARQPDNVTGLTYPVARPVAIAVGRRGHVSVIVECPYCNRRHHHGPIAGVVVAHCTGPARVHRRYRRQPFVSRSYRIPEAPLRHLLDALEGPQQ